MPSIAQRFNPLLEPLLVEFQIDSWGLEEKGFRVEKTNPHYLLLREKLLSIVPHAVDDLEMNHEIISIHPRDSLCYLNETIVIVYNDVIPDQIKTKYSFPNSKLCPDQVAIKYDTITGEAFAKVYDLDFTKYWCPELPTGTLVGWDHGVGIHLTTDSRSRYSDFYLAHTCRQTMRDFLGKLYPEYHEDFDPKFRGYCLTVDQESHSIVKAKRYVYWKDKTLEDPYTI